MRSFYALAVASALTAPTTAAVLFHEGFDRSPATYGPGVLSAPNANGLHNFSTAPITIAAGSLTNPMALPGVGNRFMGQATGFKLGTNFTYNNSANNTIWGSFLVQNVGQTNFPSGIELSVNTPTATNQNIAVYSYPFFAGVGVNGILGTPMVSYRTDGQAQLFVFRADQDSFDLWVNPASANLGTPAYTIPMASIVRINRMELNVSGVNDVDEVRLGTTQFDVMIPTPTAASVLALGGLLAARRRR